MCRLFRDKLASRRSHVMLVNRLIRGGLDGAMLEDLLKWRILWKTLFACQQRSSNRYSMVSTYVSLSLATTTPDISTHGWRDEEQ